MADQLEIVTDDRVPRDRIGFVDPDGTVKGVVANIGPSWITLRIPGRAASKARQRFDPRTKRAYTPPSNIVDENDVRAVWREAGEPRLGDDVAVQLEVLIRVIRPQGHFKKDGSLSTEGQRHPVPRSRKPDVDNALKLVMDALNSRAWRDDVRVARALVERGWSEWPETIVRFAEYYG